MSTQRNKALVDRFFDASDSDFEGAVNELVSEDCEVSNVVSSTRGREAFLQSRDVLQAAFSELRVTVQEIVAEDDEVVVRTLWAGLHRGHFLGVSPTGKPAHWSVVIFLRVRDGQIVRWWSLVDRFAIVEQLTGPTSLH